jgi:hypothetical protein
MTISFLGFFCIIMTVGAICGVVMTIIIYLERRQ